MDDKKNKNPSSENNETSEASGISRREFLGDTVKLGVSATVAAAVASGCSTLQKGMRGISSITGSTEEFEYIVVGSGAGGGPVAANLAQAGFKVLLLEAGANYKNDRYSVPILHGRSTEDPEMAWNFYVKHYSEIERQRQDSKFDAEKGGILYPRAGTVGGCTAHNAMITLYPDNEDWDAIALATGDLTWKSDEMRAYFQKVERNRYLFESGHEASRNGYDGWLQTEQTDLGLLARDAQLLEVVMSAFEAGGAARDALMRVLGGDLRAKLDPNDWRYVRDKKDGVFRIPKATNGGVRNGARERILDIIEKYPRNLELRTNALATRVLFDDRRKNEAIGIEYLEGGHLYRADPNATGSGARRRVFASKEVILAGGAFNSPQLLMLSGIGDPEELARLNIATRVNLPGVGKNLQDRYEVGVVTQLPNEFSILSKCNLGEPGDPCLEEYFQDPSKALYGSNGVSIALIEKSRPSKPTPDLCIFGIPGRFHGYFRGWAKEAFHKSQFTWAVLKGHTQNTSGTVSLKSKDPLDTPDINFRYFDEGNDFAKEDLEGVLAGVKRARSMNSKLLNGDHVEVFPGAHLKSDDQIRQYIKREAWGHHASCSNKMGPASDPTAVVDSKFKVHGVSKLRIVDASVFPRVPGLFIVAPVYMIAEKASEVIIGDARS